MKRFSISFSGMWRATLAAGLLLGATACKKNPPLQSEESTDPSGATAVAPSNAELPSAEAAAPEGSIFDLTTAQLDLGGDVFAYRELDGSAAGLAEIMEEIVKVIPEEERPPQMAELDFPGLVEDLGLTKIAAAGASSVKVGDRYLNKLYVHTPRGRDGLLRLTGREPAPFAAATIAPAGSDIVIERELNLSEGYRVVRDVIKRSMGAEAETRWQLEMGKTLGNAGIGIADLFRKLDARLTLIVRFDDSETMPIPGPDGSPLQVPKPEVYVSLDGLPFLFEKALESAPPDIIEMVKESDTAREIALPNPVFGEVVFRKEKETGRIIIAGPPSFLEECSNGEGGLFASAEFKKATEGLPEKGNGLIYMSAAVAGLGQNLLAQLIESGGAPEPLGRRGIALFTQLVPLLSGPYSGVQVNSTTGVLSVANSPASWKHALATAATLPASLITVGTSTARRVTERGQDVRVRADIGALRTALAMFQIDHGRYPTTEEGLSALVENPGGLKNWSPSLDEPFADPWQSPYEYRYPPENGRPDRPEIFSAGPDLVSGTSDDISDAR